MTLPRRPGILAGMILALACCAGPVKYAPAPEIPLERSSLDLARDVNQKLQDHLALDGDFHANDVIRLTFPSYPLIGGDQRIQLNGQISPPLLPPVQAVGLSVAQLTEKLNAMYRAKLTQPSVSISIVAYHRPPPLPEIFVMGEVARPGNYPWRDGMTLFEGLARGGGGNRDADLTRVVLLQPDGPRMIARMIDLESILRGSDQPVGYLSPFSIVLVPPTAIARNVDRSRQIRAIIGFNGLTVGSSATLIQ